MINNITNVDARMQQMGVVKPNPSLVSISSPPILSFKTPFIKEKATLKVKKFTRSDNIIIVGDIDDDYVDTIESDYDPPAEEGIVNFFVPKPEKKKTRILKNCYVIDFIQSPKTHCGLGTEAIKGLAERAMFDPKAEGRIVTYSSPVWKESSPALFFYKLGFRFMDPAGNEYMRECLTKNMPDIPPQTGMMYLPKAHLNKLLMYGEKF